MGRITSKSKTSKVYRGKNGFTSTFTKVKTNNGSTWKRTGGTPKKTKSK